MLLTLSTNLHPMIPEDRVEVIAALPDGRPALVVVIDDEADQKITYTVTDHASLSHAGIARVILAASELVECLVHGLIEPEWEVEV